VVIHPVNGEVGEPGVLPLSLEHHLVEQHQRILTKVVSEDLERHQSLIVEQTLSEESKAKVIDLVVSHVNVDETFVDCQGLSNGFSPIV